MTYNNSQKNLSIIRKCLLLHFESIYNLIGEM